MKYKVYFFLIFGIISFCSRNKEVIVPNTHELVNTGSIKILLDKESSNEIFFSNTLIREDTTYLLVFNHLINGCNIYNLATKELVRKIKIPRNGPNGIRDMAGFQVINHDTLLFVPKGNPARSQFTNFKGEFYNKEGAFKKLLKEGLINPVANSNDPIYLTNDQLQFAE